MAANRHPDHDTICKFRRDNEAAGEDERLPAELKRREVLVARLEAARARAKYRLRKQTVEPVFGVLKRAMGFRPPSLFRPGPVARFWAVILILCLPGPLPAAAQTSAEADKLAACTADICDLTLRDAIGLALSRNRALLNSRLDREVQRFSLDVAEDRWSPRVTVGPFSSRDRRDYKAGVGARMSLRVPTGGAFAFSWDETLSRRFDGARSQTLSFSQPLLKGAWADIDSAAVRQARLQERIDRLAFRQAAADLVVSATGSYRALIGAVRQVEIGEASLQRAREQLEATRALIRAGRVASREAGRSEAAIANRELSLVRARNGLEAAQFALLDILELDSRVRIRPLEALRIERKDVAFAPSQEAALHNRADYLQTRLRVDIARIALAVARNNLLPDLTIRFDWTHNDGGQTENVVRMDATVPLNDRMPELERLRARYALRKAERSVVELREAIGIGVRRAVNDVEAGLRLTDLAGGRGRLRKRTWRWSGRNSARACHRPSRWRLPRTSWFRRSRPRRRPSSPISMR